MARDFEFLESTYTVPPTPDEETLRAWQQYAQTRLQLQRVSPSDNAHPFGVPSYAATF